MITPRAMANVLEDKLTREEFLQLQQLMDNDGQAGPLWQAVSERAADLDPESFLKGVEKPLK